MGARPPIAPDTDVGELGKANFTALSCDVDSLIESGTERPWAISSFGVFHVSGGRVG